MKRKTLTIEQSILQLGRYLIGKDPTEIEDHWEKMYRDSFWVGGAMHATAISAVDCALWDILAQSLRVPVYKLLGGPTRRRGAGLLPLPRRRYSGSFRRQSEGMQGTRLPCGQNHSAVLLWCERQDEQRIFRDQRAISKSLEGNRIPEPFGISRAFASSSKRAARRWAAISASPWIATAG